MASAASHSSSSSSPSSARSDAAAATATATAAGASRPASDLQSQPRDQQHPEHFEPEAQYRQYRHFPPHQLYYPPAPEHRPPPPLPSTYYLQHHHRPESQQLSYQPPAAASPHPFPPASPHHNHGYPPSSPAGPAPGSAGAPMHSYQYQGYPRQQQQPQLLAGAAPSVSSSPSVIGHIGQQQPQPIPLYPPPTTAQAQVGVSAPSLPPTPYFPLPGFHSHNPVPHHQYHQYQGQQQQQQQPPLPLPPPPPHHHASAPQYPAPIIQPPPLHSWPLIAPSPLPPQLQANGATSGHFSVHSGGTSGQWSTHPTGPGTGRRTVTEAPLSLTQNAAQFKSPAHKRKVADYARLMLGADPDASPSFLPYRSFGEAVSLNPIYVSIGALSVYCTLCQKAFKMSTKCNLRFVQRHEQSLKHTDQLRKILAEFPPVDEACTPIPDPEAAATSASAPPPKPTKSDAQTSDLLHPPVDLGWNTAPSSRASTSVISTPAASRPNSSSPPPSPSADSMSAAAASRTSESRAATASNLGSSVIAKKAYLEESFVKHVEHNPLFTIVDETTVYCLPCSKRLKLDRARSPRTVLLHCASQVHLIKLNKYRLGEQTSAQQQVLGGGAASSAAGSSTAGGEEHAPSERRSPNLPAIITSRAAEHDDVPAHGLATPESAAHAGNAPWPSASAGSAAPAAESSSRPPLPAATYSHQPPPPTDRPYILPLPTPTWPMPMQQHPAAHVQQQSMAPNKHAATPLQSPPPSATSWSRFQTAPAASSSMSRRASPYPTASHGAVPLQVASATTPQLQSPPPARHSNSGNSPSTPPSTGLQGLDCGSPRVSASPTGSSGSQGGPGGQKMSLQFLVD